MGRAGAGGVHARAQPSVPGTGTDELFRLARSYGVGGVGKYHDFVHIDSGRVRYW